MTLQHTYQVSLKLLKSCIRLSYCGVMGCSLGAQLEDLRGSGRSCRNLHCFHHFSSPYLYATVLRDELSGVSIASSIFVLRYANIVDPCQTRFKSPAAAYGKQHINPFDLPNSLCLSHLPLHIFHTQSFTINQNAFRSRNPRSRCSDVSQH